MYKNILIATDGSELSEKAVRAGIRLAKGLGARVTLFTASADFRVFETESSMISVTREEHAAQCERIASGYLSRGEKLALASGVKAVTVHAISDHPYQAIIHAAARQRCDLVVMASHGRKGVAGVVLGSETQKVLTHSTVPVLVCR